MPVIIPDITNRVADDQPSMPTLELGTHLNVVIPSLTFGGAERMVHDLVIGLSLRGRNTPIKLFVLQDAVPAYPLPDLANLKVFRLNGMREEKKARAIALDVLTSPNRTAITHMIPVKFLRRLWDMGLHTIPVIHNSSPSWQDSPHSFNCPEVPFLIAVSDSVGRQLKEQGSTKPITVIRHELPYWNDPEILAESRRLIREQHGIRPDTVLIGMVGQFKPQKAYTRAVRVLSEVQQFANAKLMILGGWDSGYGSGRAAYTAACELALDLGVLPDMLMPGTVNPVRPYFAAFDVFLNTSIYEGLSIAMLEAKQAGCPIVSADAGGNREALPESATLVEDSSDIAGYVEGIRRALTVTERSVAQQPPHPDLIHRLWTFLGSFGESRPWDAFGVENGTLFVTDNINFGGPQRSLCNLLAQIDLCRPAYLAILDKVCKGEYLTQLESSKVLTFSVDCSGDAVDKTENLLCLIERLNIGNICFWNTDPKVKLLLAKTLFNRKIKLVDVSPGPMYFDDLGSSADFQRRICFDSSQYLARLDCFVSKYHAGVPDPSSGIRPGKVVVIPNGVPVEEVSGKTAPTPQLPEGIDSQFLIGTTCRIAPTKRIEYLLDMMGDLQSRIPDAQLIVVGGVDPRHLPYWRRICEYKEELGLENVHFVGGHSDVRPYLRAMRLFVMISEEQGCPNASLEAMAEGLPIVANPSGGTAEQVEDGVNGFLVSADQPSEMAQSVELLLRNTKLLTAFGRASRRIAAEKFSMRSMADQYSRLFCPKSSDRP